MVAVMMDPVQRGKEYMADEDYARFLEQELVPYIDNRYGTRVDRESRGVIGASLGGLNSVYLGLSRPHLFSRIGGQSSALFFAEERLAALIQQLKAGLRFYFDVGEFEAQFIPAHEKLIPMLKEKGAQCTYQVVPGGHNWSTWRLHMKELLTALWEDIKVVPVADSANACMADAAPYRR